MCKTYKKYWKNTWLLLIMATLRFDIVIKQSKNKFPNNYSFKICKSIKICQND